MMKASLPLSLALVLLAAFAGRIAADPPEPAAADPEPVKYTLRYKFQPGETVRWEVMQQARVRSTIGETTQVAETVTRSVKAWRVTDTALDGTATFEHFVERVDMRHKFTGQPEVRYNSVTDDEPPPGYRNVAESVGQVISVVELSPQGEVLKRRRKRVQAAARNQEGLMTIPLPEEPVPIGHRWRFPCTVELPLDNGTIKRVKTLQTFELCDVKTGVATIEVGTQILTPIHDPAIEAKLVQREQSGTVRFDVDAGRVLRQQMDLDRRVVGFAPSNPASSLHYVTRFTEKLLSDTPEVAGGQSEPDGSRTAAAEQVARK